MEENKNIESIQSTENILKVEQIETSYIKLLEHKKIRSHWDAEAAKWYFSIVDLIKVFTDNPNPQVYWRITKKADEGRGK